MGRLQSQVIGVVAPVALLSGIAGSPENTVWHGRHRRKTLISLRSPSLVLLVIGSTPPYSSYRSRPVAQLQPTLFMWHRPATPASGSLFPSDRLVLSAVCACAVVGAGCRGFRPNASAPYRACTPTGPVPVGLRSFLSVPTYLLSAGSVRDPPLGITACPSPSLYGPSTYGTRVLC